MAVFGHSAGNLPLNQNLRYFVLFRRSCAPMFICFFLFGRWMGGYYEQFLQVLDKHKKLIFAGTGIFFGLSLVEFALLREWATVRVSTPPDWTLTNHIFASMCTLCLLYGLRAVKHGRIDSMLIWLGRFSFTIYILHEPLLGYVSRIFNKFAPRLPGVDILLQPLLLSVTIGCCFAIYSAFLKFLGPSRARYFFG
jgi:membrane-bound acyltransferase YfiQ involved in biofilm formation